MSVVVPVRDGATFLRSSLAALRASDLARHRWELIVVDDGSQDASAAVAAELADRVLQLPAPSWGPPTARNRGARAARAPVLVFVDADVCVHPDALRRLLDVLAHRTDLTALFGSYDVCPPSPSLVSQYRNLLHAYVHHRDAGEAVTFWTGLGAVRRDAFLSVGGFDEGERIDDVELGYRLSAEGHRILLDPAIQGTHLKRWTLFDVIRTDVRDRGVPWVRLLLRQRHRVGRPTLSVRASERMLTGLAALALVALALSAVTRQAQWLFLAGSCAALVLLGDLQFLHWLSRQRGRAFALGAMPLRLLYYGLNVVSAGLALVPLSIRRRRCGDALPLRQIHEGNGG